MVDSQIQRIATYTAVTGEPGLPWRLQTVQLANGNVFEMEPHEAENLKYVNIKENDSIKKYKKNSTE